MRDHDGGPLPEHSDIAQANIAALVKASDILEDTFPDLHNDCEFFFAAIANFPTLPTSAATQRTTQREHVYDLRKPPATRPQGDVGGS